ncbi:hypothetical protein BDZ91DRAFT_710969 [Kalaharituber pfeilii]|nr:hypothetical protein BDZ91DRAFT_710969 [Kalaharituber pfeilii]
MLPTLSLSVLLRRVLTNRHKKLQPKVRFIPSGIFPGNKIVILKSAKEFELARKAKLREHHKQRPLTIQPLVTVILSLAYFWATAANLQTHYGIQMMRMSEQVKQGSLYKDSVGGVEDGKVSMMKRPWSRAYTAEYFTYDGKKPFGKHYERVMVDNLKRAISQYWIGCMLRIKRLAAIHDWVIHPEARELGIRMVESLPAEGSEPELAKGLTVQARAGRRKRMKKFDEVIYEELTDEVIDTDLHWWDLEPYAYYNLKWEQHWGVWTARLASTKSESKTREEDTTYLSPLPENFQYVVPQPTRPLTESTPLPKLVFENQESSYFHRLYYQHISPISWEHQQMSRLLPVRWTRDYAYTAACDFRWTVFDLYYLASLRRHVRAGQRLRVIEVNEGMVWEKAWKKRAKREMDSALILLKAGALMMADADLEYLKQKIQKKKQKNSQLFLDLGDSGPQPPGEGGYNVNAGDLGNFRPQPSGEGDRNIDAILQKWANTGDDD